MSLCLVSVKLSIYLEYLYQNTKFHYNSTAITIGKFYSSNFTLRTLFFELYCVKFTSLLINFTIWSKHGYYSVSRQIDLSLSLIDHQPNLESSKTFCSVEKSHYLINLNKKTCSFQSTGSEDAFRIATVYLCFIDAHHREKF